MIYQAIFSILAIHGKLSLFLTAHVWKTQRKQLAPCYSSQVTWSFLPIFNQKANLMVRNVGRHIGKGNFDIMNYSSACALDIVCGSLCYIYLFNHRQELA